MRRSALRPCDHCGADLEKTFYVARIAVAIFNPSPAREDLAVILASDIDRSLCSEIFLCEPCISRTVNLALLAERVASIAAGAHACEPH
jgi:hypothetical protein